MEDIARNAVDLLRYLLPGFLAAWVFYGFTAYPKPSQFERVVQALIFTLIIEAVVQLEKLLLYWIGTIFALGPYDGQTALVCSTLTAIGVGILFSLFANNNKCHDFARKIGITRQTSYPSEWFGAFLQNVTYVVLQLEDERRIYGWPLEWPSEPTKGHFVLQQASWIVEGKDEPITGVESVLISVRDVKWVEFMEKT